MSRLLFNYDPITDPDLLYLGGLGTFQWLEGRQIKAVKIVCGISLMGVGIEKCSDHFKWLNTSLQSHDYVLEGGNN